MSDEKNEEVENEEPQREAFPIVAMACRRSTDPRKKGSCDCKEALMISSNKGHSLYRCAECSYSWSVSVGQPFEF